MTLKKGLTEGVGFWVDVFNPWNYFDLMMDPSPSKAKKQARNAGIKSTLMATAATGAWALSSPAWRPIVGAPSPSRMFALKADTIRAIAQFGFQQSKHVVRATPNVAIVAAPVVLATAAAISYEKNVNEFVRDSTGGSRGNWFGPFASGFGSVV